MPWSLFFQFRLARGEAGPQVRFARVPKRPALLSLLSVIAIAVGCGKESTPTQPSGPACSYSVLAAPSAPVAAAGTEFEVTIVAPDGCGWNATSNAAFITVAGAASGTGTAKVRFAVQPNAGTARQGTVQVAGNALTIQQLAAGTPTCDYEVTPATATMAQPGGQVPITVQTAAGCAWTATTTDAFVTVDQPSSSGMGNGTVLLIVAANSGQGRSGTASIAGKTVTISQAGTTVPPQACTFSVWPGRISIDAAGGTAPIEVTVTQGANCAWTAVSGTPFLAFDGAAAGVGSGTVTLSVGANIGSARTGVVSVAGQTITVSQGAAPSELVAVVSFTSDPGDTTARGQSKTVTLSGSEFTALLDTSQSELRFNAPNAGNPWLNVTLQVPAGQRLAPGLYEHAERWPFQAPGRPGLSASTNSNGCNKVTGRFLIANATYVGTKLLRFHARIEHHCEGSSPAFRAEIWIAEYFPPPPLAQFPPTPTSPTTFFNSQSDPGYVGGPFSKAYSLSNATFSAWGGNGTGQGVGVSLDSLSSSDWWHLSLNAPTGQQLQIGTYENAARFPSATQPGLDLLGLTMGCNTSSGRFVVLEIRYGPQGELERFRATFETKCTGAPAGIRGEIYIVADPWR